MLCFLAGPVSDSGPTAFAQAGPGPAADTATAPQDGAAPDVEPAAAPGSADFGWSFFPAVFYSPETSVMFAGIALLSFRVGDTTGERATARRSAIPSFVAYTLNNQFIVTTKPSVHLRGETYWVGGTLEATWFPDKLWEVGPDSADDSEEDYTKKTALVELRATRLVARALRLGVQLRVAYLALDDLAAGGLLDGGALVGSEGGTEVGLGPALVWDRRDNEFAPRRGSYLSLSSHFHNDALGSFTYQSHVVDARHYLNVGGQHVLAGQLYAKLTSGGVPFEGLAKLGGAMRMRGFYDGRFRDRHMAIAQLDYRSPPWWRFSGAAFVAAGTVAHAADELLSAALRVAGGGGLRFLLSAKDRAALRLDIAGTSTGEVGFYLQLGEAF